MILLPTGQKREVNFAGITNRSAGFCLPFTSNSTETRCSEGFSTTSVDHSAQERVDVHGRGKLVRLPVPERSEILCAVSPSPVGGRATVLDMQEWKSKVPGRKTRKDREARRGWLQKLHAGELVPLIWGRIGDDDVDDDLLREVLLLLGEPEPDEDPGA